MKLAAATLAGSAVLLWLPGAVPAEPAPAPITVLLVRHAEKASGGGADPALSEAGAARATELARLCGHSRATALYATPFVRTRSTLEPLAQQLGVELQTRDPKEVDALAAELRKLAPGSVAVVAGHSNTVPALAKALGAELGGLTKGMLAETEFDRLFVLSVDPAAARPTGWVELRYGADSAAPTAAPK